MFKNTKAFTSFSADDLQKPKSFTAKHSGWKFPKRKRVSGYKSPAAARSLSTRSLTILQHHSRSSIFRWMILKKR